MYGKSSWCVKQKLEENRLCELRECSDDGSGNTIMSLNKTESEEDFLIRLLDDELNKEVLNIDKMLFRLNRVEWDQLNPAPQEEFNTTVVAIPIATYDENSWFSIKFHFYSFVHSFPFFECCCKVV